MKLLYDENLSPRRDSKNSKLIALLSGRIRVKKNADRHELPSEQVRMLRLWIDSGAR